MLIPLETAGSSLPLSVLSRALRFSAAGPGACGFAQHTFPQHTRKPRALAHVAADRCSGTQGSFRKQSAVLLVPVSLCEANKVLVCVIALCRPAESVVSVVQQTSGYLHFYTNKPQQSGLGGLILL